MTAGAAARTGELRGIPPAATHVAPPAGRPLRIALLGYRSHPFGGGQGVYIKYLSKALVEAGHEVDVISGPPYPHLDPRVRLIELPSLDLFANGLGSLRPRHLKSLTNIIEWTSKLTGGFAEPYTFGRRAVKYLKAHRDRYDLVHDNQSLSYGMLEIQRMGIPLVTTLHHPITSDLRIALTAARRWHERLLIRRWHSFLGMQKKVVRRLEGISPAGRHRAPALAADGHRLRGCAAQGAALSAEGLCASAGAVSAARTGGGGKAAR